jgi:hypothetical protein
MESGSIENTPETFACICAVPGVFGCRWAIRTGPSALVIAIDTIEGRDELTGGVIQLFTNPPVVGGSNIRVSCVPIETHSGGF